MNSSQEDNNLKKGDVLRDRYRILEKLNQGGFGTIYLAQDKNTSLGTQYIIKQFTPLYKSDYQLATAQRLFTQEAQVLQTLGQHSQIPRIHDYFENDGEFFLVQDFIKGKNFQEELNTKESFTQTEIVEFLNDVLPILDFVHENQYIHRDIKPSNLIRNSVDKKIYLIDFGAVKEKINPQNLDTQGQFYRTVSLGTQGYTPMEQTLGKPEFCSDIYALGMIVIQAITKVDPINLEYDHNNNPIWQNLIPQIKTFHPQFLEIIEQMVRCSHKQRYQSAKEILKALKSLDFNSQFEEDTVIIKRKSVDTTQIISEPKVPPINSTHYPESSSNKKFQKQPWFIPGVVTLLIATIVAITFILKNNQSIFSGKLLPYENSEYGFKLKYPETWTWQEDPNFLDRGIIFYSDYENSNDKYREKVKIQSSATALSLAEYTQVSMKEIENSNLILEQPKTVNLANTQGKRIIYQTQQGTKQMETWVIKNHKAYILIYTAETDKYDKFLGEVEAIVKSFQTIN